MPTISFRIDDQTKARIDRLSQSNALNPSEVFRRALDQALNQIEFGSDSNLSLNLDLVERLKLVNQYEILARLERDETQAVVWTNNAKLLKAGYGIQFGHLVQDYQGGLGNDECVEVLRILDMHSIIRNVLAHQNGPRELMEEAAFLGFSSTNEAAYFSFSAYLILELNHYDDLRDRVQRLGLDTVYNMLPRYRRMLQIWEHTENPYNPTIDEIKGILTAGAQVT